jgi:hypothetical protein
MKTQYQLDREERWKADGFVIFDDAKPPIGVQVEAIRVFQPRGFGGVILRTEYKIVPIIRDSEYGYSDTLNNDAELAYSEFEGWREFQTYAIKDPEQPIQQAG